MRRFSNALFLPVIVSLLLVAMPPGWSASPVSVTFKAVGSTIIAQGLPFRARATLDNPDATPQTVSVMFTIRPAGVTDPHVDFTLVTRTVPALGKVDVMVAATSAQWFSQVGSFELAASIDGEQAGDPIPFQVTDPSVTTPTFEDVTATTGLSTTFSGSPCGSGAQIGTTGAGAAWGDADGDEDLDLYLPHRDSPAQLFINEGGRFEDRATELGVTNSGSVGVGAVFANFDNDGDQDLYVVNEGPNRLYLNDGTGHFTDVAEAAGVADDGNGKSASWGDYDNDGWLDLYVVNRITCDRVYQYDRLYHNEGDGTFVDKAFDLLEGDPADPADGSTLGAGFQAAFFDYDADGDQDIYLANDYVGASPDGNHLWRNDGPGPAGEWTFTDVSAASRTGYRINSMGIGIGDHNQDLRLDIAISNIGGNKLLTNKGDGTFVEQAKQARVDRPFQDASLVGFTWGLGFYDFNNDGWEDLYVAQGEHYGSPGPRPNELFVRGATLPFFDLSAPSGGADPGASRGVAFADYDRDGRVDVYVVNVAGNPHLWRNTTATGNHWIEVDPEGTLSNRDGCGARVTVVAGGVTMVREVFCGSIGFASGSDSIAHFGLGTALTVSSVALDWPSGIHQVIENAAVDQLMTVTES